VPSAGFGDLMLLLIVLSVAAAAAGVSHQDRIVHLGGALGALAYVVVAALGVGSLIAPSAAIAYARLWGRWSLVVGPTTLGGFFLVALAVVGAAVALYAPRYVASYATSERAVMRALLPLFVASMAFVLLARDAVTFLAAWEGMSLASLGLVLTEHRHGGVRRAGFVYFVATHTGALALAGLFALVWAHGLGIGFAGYAVAVPRLGLGLRSLLLALAMVGFGSKAALVPMHVWLPRAHPVAPSHVSALMSGVMIKVALYGLILAVFSWLGPGPVWWGAVLVALGAASALLGVLYALMEHGLKVLLAYHSVENVGIVVLGLGAAELARSTGASAVAAFALAAALFHVWNHAVFKAGLFLAAGSVRSAVGSDDLERLGGLGRAMPLTALAFLLLSVAISGLPPFNGFASEWMTLESLLRLAHGSALAVTALALLGALALALTGGLAAACFVKASGVGLLGPARTPEAAGAREVGWPMWAAPLGLVALSLGLGLSPGAVADLGMRVAGGLWPSVPTEGGPWTAPALALTSPWTTPEWPLLWLSAGAVVALGVLGSLGSGFAGAARRAPAWACGGELTAASAFTATAFSKSLRQIFAPVYRSDRVLVRTGGALPYLLDDVRYRSVIRHVVDQHLYRPVQEGGLAAARALRRLQSGSLRRYVGYLLVALLAALGVFGR
jgi:hydrogenase-4 component B